jgi:hypothetical protein
VAEVIDRGHDLPADREGRALVSQQPAQVSINGCSLVEKVGTCVLPSGDQGDLGHGSLLQAGIVNLVILTLPDTATG